MKKSLILLGMLSIGYAHAQSTDPYEGKVGINTSEPKATLNVKSKIGTTAITKNFELENAGGLKMVTVLDNGKVGVGTESPTYKLELVAKDNDYGESSIGIRSFRTGASSIDVFKARGSVSAPLSLVKGDVIANWGSIGYNGTNYMSTAGINTYVTGDVTEGQVPTSITFLVRNPSLTTYNASNANGRISVMTVHHSAKVGIGTTEPTEKLHISGAQNKVKIENLSGTGNRPVYADENGVLVIGTGASTSTGATTLTGETGLECNATNRGKMNFVPNDNGSDVFGICLRNKDGNYYWGYMVGGNNPTNGTGAFGSGL